MLQDVAFFDQNKTGELMNRLSADTTGTTGPCDRPESWVLVGVKLGDHASRSIQEADDLL